MNFLDNIKNSFENIILKITGDKIKVNYKNENIDFDSYGIFKVDLGYIVITPKFSNFLSDLILGIKNNDFTSENIEITKKIIINVLSNLKETNTFIDISTNIEIVDNFDETFNQFIYEIDFGNEKIEFGIVLKDEFLNCNYLKPILTQEEINSLLKIIEENDDKEITNKINTIINIIKNAELIGNLINPGIFIQLDDARMIINYLNIIKKELK